MLKLYNTLSRQIEEVKPLKSDITSIYTCGPTVYNYPHIGNWFTFIRYDILIRTLKKLGANPTWVLNITDVGHLVSDGDEGEDKLEVGAKRENKNAWEIAKFYSDYFFEGLKRLNISAPTYTPKATEHIQEQIDLIKRLEDKNYTYVIDDGVYYDTSKFPRYADFARLDLDEQQSQARIDANPSKKNAADFALWKFSPNDANRDMEWDSPWGKGFPGWHIECSAMCFKYFGETVDLHCGGIDHIPTHHSNEIAQSEAAFNKPLASIWMHTNHITVDDQKIAKSLGNSITLEDVEDHGLKLMALRLHVLESHYRSQSKFSWASLESAQNRLKDLYNLAVLRYQTNQSTNVQDDGYFLQAINSDLLEPMSDDLSSPLALARVSERQNVISEQLVHPNNNNEFEKYLSSIDELFGLDLMAQQDISDNQKELLGKRDEARVNQDWQASDEIRNILEKDNVGVRDTQYGQIWYRT